jgi:hypothetical protein
MNYKKSIQVLTFVLFLFSINFKVFAYNNFSDTALRPTAITLNITTVSSTCEKANAKIIVNASGGVLPYTYILENAYFEVTAAGVFYNITGGTYLVKVTDAVGTIATQTVTVLNNMLSPTMTVSDKVSPTDCTTPNGSLKINAAGGLPPYMYSLDEINYQTSNVFTNLHAGDYTYLVKDANGCIGAYQEISQQTQSYLPQSASCPVDSLRANYGSSCGGAFSIGVSVYNEVKYKYSLDGINYQDSRYFLGITPAGLYTIWIKDRVTGVILKYAITLHEYCSYAFNVTHTTQPYTCSQNGSITVTATDGLPPYKYSIDGVNFQTSNQFTGLQAGTYTLTVKDAQEFLVSRYVQIINTCLQVQASNTSSTCGNSNGSITATATNGTAPYQYALGTGAYSSSNTFTGLAAASYVVNVKDATGRVATANTIVSNIAGAQIAAADTTPTNCNNNTGTINVLAQAGTTPYLYSIDGSNFVSSNIFTGLAQNNYTVTVKDGRGCLTTKPALITLANTLQVHAGDTLKICEGKNGTTNATGNATTYAWLPTGGLAMPAMLNTAANPTVTTTYYLTGTTGVCTKKDSMQVLVKPAPIANAGQGATICYGQNTTLQAATGQQSYTWSPTTYLANINGATAEVVKPQNNITYSLSVVGTNGCASLQAAQVTIQVTPPPKVFVGNDTSIAIGEPFTIAAQDVNNSGSYVPYSLR